MPEKKLKTPKPKDSHEMAIQEAERRGKLLGLRAAIGCCAFLDKTSELIRANIQAEIDNLEKTSLNT